MKYLPLLLLLAACNNHAALNTEKAPLPHLDSLPAAASWGFNKYGAVKTKADSDKVQTAIHYVSHVKEVKEFMGFMDSAGEGKHIVSFVAQDGFKGNTTYYCLVLEDSPHYSWYIPPYKFVMAKQTGKVKVYYGPLDSLMEIEDWRRVR